MVNIITSIIIIITIIIIIIIIIVIIVILIVIILTTSSRDLRLAYWSIGTANPALWRPLQTIAPAELAARSM
jgi:hypothetical protein